MRVGLVGFGNAALGGHVPAYAKLRDLFEVVGLADPTPERLELGREMLGLEAGQVHLDATAMIARPDIDVIDICVPQHLHRQIAVGAAEAGKHVLCEKPLATTPRDAAEMVAAARLAGVALGVVHNYLFWPEIAESISLLEAGRIGHVEVAILNYLGVHDLPGNAAYRPNWRHDLAQAGGGVLMDMLHVVYVAEALLGAPFERVSAYMAARELGSPVEDICLCRFETENSAALVNIGWGMGAGGISVSGTRGRIEIRYQGGGTSPFVPLESVTVVDELGPHPITVQPSLDSLTPLLRDFGRAIVEGREPMATGEQALRTLEATVGAYVSAATGRAIELPLAQADPAFELGVQALGELELPPWSPLRRRSLFARPQMGG
jgi:predicted dehydrogenase